MEFELAHKESPELQPYERVARTVMLCRPDEVLSGKPGPKEVRLARKNGLGLEFAAHFSEGDELEEQERQRLEFFQDAMQTTSQIFTHHHIEHIFFKFRKLYRYYDSNVDVIVHKDQWEPATHALQMEGYQGNVMFKEPDKLMFSKPGVPVSIHLHPGVTWNGVPYFDVQDLWENSQPSLSFTNARELPDSYDFLVNLAHNVFENYEISLGDTLYFVRFIRSHSLEVNKLEAIAAKNGWSGGFERIYAQVVDLVGRWEATIQSGCCIPESLLAYPYRIPAVVLGSAFSERIASNLARKCLGAALREVYAYPAFYALKRRHDLAFLTK